jgi:hypothetical protein
MRNSSRFLYVSYFALDQGKLDSFLIFFHVDQCLEITSQKHILERGVGIEKPLC